MLDSHDSSKQTVSSITVYLNEIGQHQMLTAEEEIELSKLIMTGNQAAEQLKVTPGNKTLARQVKAGKAAQKKLVEANLRLVVSVAKKYQKSGVHFLDLIQEGNIGLINAASRFDYNFGNKFSTYAVWWIEQAVVKAVETDTAIRLPTHVAESASKVRRAWQRLTQLNYHEPTAEEIAYELNISVAKATELLNLVCPPISLETPCGSHEKTIEDTIESNEKGPCEELIDNSVCQEMSQLLSDALSDREQQVIRYRYGFVDGHVWSQPKIGALIGVSKQRVEQIEKNAMKKLRKSQYAKRLTAML